MNHGIVIIGSGFAARQLVKNIRKQDARVPLTLIAADSMDEYNKPDLSHVISQSQRADDLTPSIDELRRDQRWAIRDLKGESRVTVELI